MSIYLGKREVRLMSLGAGHTSGDIVAWVPDAEVMFSGDLIEYHSACYCGDAHLREWPTTLNEIRAFNPKAIAPGRGDALKGLATARDAIAMTRDFVTTLYGAAEASVAKGRSLKESMAATREVMDPKFQRLCHLRALPAVQRLARVRRGFRDRRSRDLDRQARPGNVGRPARRRMTMNINTSPDTIVRSSAQITPGYMSGFGNSFETEALPGALPVGRNSPQRCAYGLYAEQLSGSPFTAPRGTNERSWLYRIRPSVKHSGRFAKVDAGLWRTAPCHEYELPIAQLRWDPAPIPKDDKTFLQGVQTMTTAGDANTQAGMAAHVYLITKSMVDQHFYNADGEMMFVAQQGNLRLVTEFGRIDIEPGEIAVIPRGVKFRVEIPEWPGARLSLRELRRRLHAAGARPDRRQLPRQFARLPHAGRRVRRQGHADRAVREMGRLAVQDHAAAFADRRGGLARQLRALQIRSAHVLAGRRHRLRPSRSLDFHGADLAVGDRRAPRISTS